MGGFEGQKSFNHHAKWLKLMGLFQGTNLVEGPGVVWVVSDG